MLQSLETKLNELFVKNAPALPEGFRKWLGTYAWVFALIGLVLGAISCLALLPLIGLGSIIGSSVGDNGFVFFIWVSLLVLIGYTILLGVATPKLKRMEKSGWDLIFYSNLFFIAYNLFNWLRYINFGSIFGLIWDLLWAAAGLYFVFQVRSQFTGKTASAAKASPAAPVKKPAKKA